MKLVIQRVSQASVIANGEDRGQISQGLVVLLGVAEMDTVQDVDWLVNKLVNMRVFNDEEGRMNHSLLDVDGELVVVSQFTLQASTKKGHRPSYIAAAKHDIAIPLYEDFVAKSSALIHKPVITGVFGADMQISIVNDGPVTIVIDSKNRT